MPPGGTLSAGAACCGRGRRRKNPRHAKAACAEGFRDGTGDGAGLTCLDQGDGTAAEAAADHAGAQGAGVHRRVHGSVELRTGNLKVVPKRSVRVGQERTGAAQVACFEPVNGSQHAGIVGDDMASPPADDRVCYPADIRWIGHVAK
jgi:hypothetical protein